MSRVGIFSGLIPGLILCAGPAASAQILSTEMVQVDADTELATDVWLPADDWPDGGWPVILRRTPYGRTMSAADVAGLTSMGFVFVSQDVRGRGGSQGRFLPFLNDAQDGRVAIEWAASQPWSSGRVCLWGGSAEGIVQLMAAGAGPEGLAGAIPMVATDDIYEGLLAGGVWRQELTGAWLQGLGASDVELEWRQNEADGPYWDRGRLTPEKRSNVDFPILMIGGFFDIFAHSQPRMHREMVRDAAPDARDDQFLVFGPWTHGGVTFDADAPVVEGQVTFVRQAAYDYIWLDIVDFLEWVLVDGDRPAWAPVTYFRTCLSDDGFSAEGTWRTLDLWPPAGRPVSLCLTDNNSMVPDRETAGVGWYQVPVDPSDPVPTVGGNNLTVPAGIFDQSEVDARADVLVFETLPVNEETVVEGDVIFNVKARFSGTDGDIMARLSQVTPSGSVMLLSDGAIRARFIADATAPSAVEPDREYEVRINLGPVAVMLRKGHALRLSVSGTGFPGYEPNPGVFSPLADMAEPVAGSLRIKAAESCLELNVTQGDEWPSTDTENNAGGGCSAVPGPAGNPYCLIILLLFGACLGLRRRV